MSGDQTATSGDRPPLSSTKRGFIWGIGVALLSTLVAYALMWPSEFSQRYGIAVMVVTWLGPLVAAIVLTLFDRTRSLGGGLAAGIMLTWVISVPTCVVVTWNTVPNLVG